LLLNKARGAGGAADKLDPKIKGRLGAQNPASETSNLEARSPKSGQKQRNRHMASEKAQNLQDTFLNHVRKTKTSVTIFLVNGVKLQGFVSWFDNFCLLLRRDGHSQLVYKHAISTIMPAHPIQMFESGDEPAGAEKS
jgi:host factor-I protein